MMTGPQDRAEVAWESPYITSMQNIHARGWDGGDDEHVCMYDTEAFPTTVIEGCKAMARTRPGGMRAQEPIASEYKGAWAETPDDEKRMAGKGEKRDDTQELGGKNKELDGQKKEQKWKIINLVRQDGTRTRVTYKKTNMVGRKTGVVVDLHSA